MKHTDVGLNNLLTNVEIRLLGRIRDMLQVTSDRHPVTIVAPV